MTTPAFVQGGEANSGGAVSCVFGSNNAANNLIVLAFTVGPDSGVGTIHDTNSNHYTLAGFTTTWLTDGAFYAGIYYAYNIAAGANTITFTPTSGTNPVCLFHEYSGVQFISDPIDGFSIVNTGTATTFSSGNLMTTVNGDLQFGSAQGQNGGISFTSGLTQRENFNFNTFASADKVVGNVGSYAFTGTCSSGNTGSMQAFFKPAIPFLALPNDVMFVCMQ